MAKNTTKTERTNEYWTEKKYDCNGIETEADRLLISNATDEIYILTERAENLLCDLITDEFGYSAEYYNDKLKASDLLSRYREISAQLYAAHDALWQANTLFDLICGVKSNRTVSFIADHKMYTQFDEFRETAVNE